MSTEGHDYPFLKKSVMQHFSNSQKGTSPTRSTPGMSTKTKSDELPLKSQTMYDGDDELSELPVTHQDTTDQHASPRQNTPVTDHVSISVSETEAVTIKHDDSSDEATEAQDEPTPPASSGNNVQNAILVTDPVCAGETDGQCTLRSGDHRKVVSHIFGRNKRCTHQIPEECWIKYCRKHYQRQKYRRPDDWPDTQLQLIDGQLDKMENWGGISSWTIAIRKKERVELDAENALLAQHGSLPEGKKCRERFLLPYLGSGKTFQDVRDLIDIVNKECDNHKGDKDWKDLPSFELLPEIDERRNPRPRRGASRRIISQSHVRASVPSTFRLSVDPSGQLTKVPAKSSSRSISGPATSNAASSHPKHVSGAYAPVSRLEKTEGAEAEGMETQIESASTLKRASSESGSDDSIEAEILRPSKRSRANSV
ncbi:MAG: hypothetical protein LQ352_002557 [Teloschistes flavicans]|nr:MAG: hypothetical protein LQ352_002557 [Teloschistes flavicans]